MTKEQPHKKQESLPTEQVGMEERFDKRFRFAGTYAMGELQANNIKSFIRQEQLALLERIEDGLAGGKYINDILTSEKKRLMGNNN